MPRKTRIRSALVAGVVAAVVLISACTPGTPVENPTPSSASTSADFYDVPSPLAYGAPGALIRIEPLRVLPEGARGWRLLYHSRDPLGADIAVSGTLYVPTAAAASGGRPLVAWAHGTTGLGDNCAPSKGTDPLSLMADGQALLSKGYAVVATDYAGIGTPGVHPYLIGPSESAAVLDSVRAARAVQAAEVGSQTVVLGFSQGGHAAAFVAQDAAGYAPEIDLSGVVAVAPPTDLTRLAAHFATLSVGPAYLLMLAAGYSAVDSGAVLDTLLTAAGRQAAELLDSGCVGELVPDVQGKKVTAIFADNPRTTAPWAAALKLNSVGDPADGLPVLVLQGAADPLVPAAETTQAVAAWCKSGATVDYRTYDGLGHEFSAREQGVAADWIADRFAGKTAASTC